MRTLTEEQIGKIARNLLLAPQVMENLAEFDKLRREDTEGDFRAILQKAYHLVKDGFKEFGDVAELSDASYVWVLKRFADLDFRTIIMCLDRGLASDDRTLIVLALNVLLGMKDKQDFPLQTVAILARMNRIILEVHDDDARRMAWDLLGKANEFAVVEVEDWKAYSRRLRKISGNQPD